MYSHEPMTLSPADFAGLFDGCRDMRESHEAYKEGIRLLQEAHRLCMVRLVSERDRVSAGKPAKRSPQNEAQVALVVKQSRDAKIRNWASTQGIVFQRVNKGLRAMYDEAHPDE